MFEFGVKEQQAFEALKAKLTDAPILSIYSPKDETELHCDASSLGYGAILMQRKSDGKFHPIFYFSKRTSDTESRYHSFELETLAIIYALKRFRIYLQGLKFKIVTDCNSLTQTLNKKEINPRIARWALELQHYDYTPEHRAGTRMTHVDALSRSNAILVIEDNPFEWNLTVSQSRDPEIVKIRERLEKSEDKLYEMRNGVIFRKKNDELRFYVPAHMENNVLYKYHDEMGHLGVEKTTDAINSTYWFPNLRSKVETHIRNCLKCIAFSPSPGRSEGFLHIVPKGKVPFSTIHIDHLGPIDQKNLIKRHILVVVDAFTKYVKLYATKTTSSKEAIASLIEYFASYSRPNCVISDRGSCFTSQDFEAFLKEYHVKHILIATGSPQANGQVERVNRVLTPMLAKLTDESVGKYWYRVLHQVEYALNNTIHKTTGETASRLLFGVEQRGDAIDDVKEYLNNEVYPSERNIEEMREKAADKIAKSQEYNKNYHDKHRKESHEYDVGDYVMLRNFDSTVSASKKLMPKFKGPYIVSKKLRNDRYVISDVEGYQNTQKPYQGVWEPKNLRPWNSAELPVND